jgi:hypothetical protein
VSSLIYAVSNLTDLIAPKRETPNDYLVNDADLADFVANEQEFHRRSNNSVIDLRTLHEIYLEPFRLQCRAKPVAFVRTTGILSILSLIPR